jgi:hypothetical protein
MARADLLQIRPGHVNIRCERYDRFNNLPFSRGTSEFYTARAAITKRLIEEHVFNIVAIKRDWPDAHVIDQFVRGKPRPASLAMQPHL